MSTASKSKSKKKEKKEKGWSPAKADWLFSDGSLSVLLMDGAWLGSSWIIEEGNCDWTGLAEGPGGMAKPNRRSRRPGDTLSDRLPCEYPVLAPPDKATTRFPPPPRTEQPARLQAKGQ